MPSHTSLKSVSNISDILLSKSLELNLSAHFQWGLLGIGGFFNINVPTSGAYGGDQSRLRLVTEDSNYTSGRVWEGFRSDWVWETGVEYPYQPIHVSGVWVNSVFYPTVSTTGAYAHHVEYPAGRVVFNSAIATNSTVQASYSFRYVHFTHGSVPWWRQVQTRSLRNDDAHFLTQGSGAWSLLSQNRIQLPAVIVDAAPNCRTSAVGYELGSMVAIRSQDVMFHILAEEPDTAKNLHDLIISQNEKSIFLFDVNQVYASGALPLDSNGTPVSGVMKMYPDLVKENADGGFRSNTLRFARMASADSDNPVSIWRASVRATFETLGDF